MGVGVGLSLYFRHVTCHSRCNVHTVAIDWLSMCDRDCDADCPIRKAESYDRPQM